MHPVHTFPSYSNTGFPIKTLYEILVSPMRATRLAYPILLHFITPITFSEAYKL
jgi:hypothetical protein